jgi:dipeptidyl aminopeptidase/acylaminoacyl peptidase
MAVRPYGFWTSPITSELVVGETVRLDQVALDADAIYWTESQPARQGRYFIYRARAGGEPEAVTPDDANAYNVRTRVHEYGGGAFLVHDATVYFSNFADQRLYRQTMGVQPQPITSAATPAGGLRYADGQLDRGQARIICVQENHSGPGPAVNALVSIDVAGNEAPRVLIAGNDFYSSPRLSPDGKRLAWLTWNHPNMPWVATELWVGEVQVDGSIGHARLVAGGPDEALFQPEWSPDGDLYFVSDRRGWWNIYRERNGVVEPMAPMEAEFGVAQWNFGLSTYAFESAERLVCAFVRDGTCQLARLDTRSKELVPVATPYTDIAQLRARPGRAVFIGASPSEAPAVVDFDLDTDSHRIIRRSAVLRDEIKAFISVPQSLAFTTEAGEVAHALFYLPQSPLFSAPDGEKIPVLVKNHGGPTASASSALSLSTQYWTSRGIGILDVNYRGSTGFGRRYRLRLEKQWGILDVQDCVHGASALVEKHGADPRRLMISGGSAGGYTTLCALTAPKVTFAAGASYYGVSDLVALARDTHKFESRYLDWLIGPYPQDEATYIERSPINHIDRLSVPVIFFQGVDDKVVPPNQTEMMVEGLKTSGVPVGYFLFDGEQHGFRRAENIRRSLDAELYFYALLVLRSGLHF